MQKKGGAIVSWTFITVTYNSEVTLKKFWNSPLPDSVQWVVVDNGSSDSSGLVAKSLGAEVIAVGLNIGFSSANNLGLEQAKSDYVAFVNPDVTVDFDTLNALSASIDRCGGLVAPQLINLDGTLQPNGRGFPILTRKIMNRLRPRASHPNYRITTEIGETKAVPWVIGAVVAGRKESFKNLNGWDSNFFLYYEDSDLCLRAWASGLPVNLCGNVRWIHGWARETAKFKFQPWKRELGSLIRFYRKYPSLLVSDGAWSKTMGEVISREGIHGFQ